MNTFRDMTTIEKLVLLAIVAILILIPFSLMAHREVVPCEKYGNFAAKDVPVRCLKYFQIEGGEFK